MDEYFNQSLQDLHIKSKSARFDNGYILEAKFGEISFELPGPGKRFIFHFKRQNGNGKIELSFLNQLKSISIISKISQIISLDNDFEDKTIVTISRPKDSVGEIVILGISIDNPEITESNKNKWKNVFSKCSEYHGIKILGNKLIAGEGAYIAPASIIKSINTNPNNATVIKNDKLSFLTKSEILSIEFYTTELNQNLFIPRNPPNPDLVNYNSQIGNYTPTIPTFQKKSTFESLPTSNRLIFDSDSSKNIFNKFITKQNKNVKILQSNSKDILCIKNGGEYIIPFSVLKPNSNYVVVLKNKRINGSGKLRVGLISQSHSNFQMLICNNNFEEQSVYLKTGQRSYPDENFKLSLKLEDPIGDLQINKLAIFEGLSNPKSSESPILYDDVVSVISSSFTIKDSTKKSATIFIEEESKKFSFPYILEPLTYSSRRWVGNLSSYVSDLKIKDDDNLLVGAVKTTSEPDLVLGKLGELKVCKRLFLEEWGYQDPSNADWLILNQCENIITPSIKNLFVLKQKCPNCKISLGMKRWILPEVYSEGNSGHFIYFEKNESITYALAKNWQTYFPFLYVVGSNLDLPTHIKKVSEYMPYKQLIKLIASALCCIDFSLNSQYNSSIIDLAYNLGCNIITNNINQMNEHLHYVNLDFNQNMIDINFEKLNQKINTLHDKKSVNNLYNDLVKDSLEKMVNL